MGWTRTPGSADDRFPIMIAAMIFIASRAVFDLLLIALFVVDLKQRRLPKEIGARVASDAKLGENHDVTVGQFPENIQNRRGIGLRIGHRGRDRRGSEADESETVHDGSHTPRATFYFALTAIEPNPSDPETPHELWKRWAFMWLVFAFLPST